MQVKVYNDKAVIEYGNYLEIIDSNQVFELMKEKAQEFKTTIFVSFEQTNMPAEVEEKLCYTNGNWYGDLEIRVFEPTEGSQLPFDMIADWFYRVFFLKEKFVYSQFEWVGDFHNTVTDEFTLDCTMVKVNPLTYRGVGVKVNGFYYLVGIPDVLFEGKQFIGVKNGEVTKLEEIDKCRSIHIYMIDDGLKYYKYVDYTV